MIKVFFVEKHLTLEAQPNLISYGELERLLNEAGIEDIELFNRPRNHITPDRAAISPSTIPQQVLVIWQSAPIDRELLYFVARSPKTILLCKSDWTSSHTHTKNNDPVKTEQDIDSAEFRKSFQGVAFLRDDVAAEFLRGRLCQAEFDVFDMIVKLAGNAQVDKIVWPLSSTQHRAGGGSYARANLVTRFRKEARKLGRRKLRDEIRFLKRLPEPLQEIYPHVSGSGENEECVFMEQEFLPLVTLRQYLFTSDTTSDLAFAKITRIVETLQKLAYSPYQIPCPTDYLEQYHFQRLWHRLKHTMVRATVFSPILLAQTIWINGQAYRNVPQLLHQFERSEKAVALAKPDFVSPYVHGDLHFENIMVDPASDEFRLVDPRGYDYCDVYYDLGKISHSVNGKYDFLHENRFSLKWHADGQDIEAELFVTPSRVVKLYDEIDALARDFYRAVTDDPLAEERTLFAEAMHFCTMMPFHLTGDGRESKSIAIYLTGVMLFNRVFERFGIAPDWKNNVVRDFWGQEEWRNVG